jgi:anhydro-N-acetylmuramic acid kinase
MNNSHYIGIMSGTSVDGIDCCLVNFDQNNTLSVCKTKTFPINDDLKIGLNELIVNQVTNPKLLKSFDHYLGIEYAHAVNSIINETNFPKDKIKAIGISGQTISHQPNFIPPHSIQIGNAKELSLRTGIAVVHDFRAADIRAGGQGAPLLPLFHQFLCKRNSEPTIFINIGGISNLTYINNNEVIGFDCGPGNTLIDCFSDLLFSAVYDEGGTIASKGKVNEALLQSFLSDNFFHCAYPKSTGREHFNYKWAQFHLNKFDIPKEDIITTLTELTAECISQDIQRIAKEFTGSIFVYGGGSHNLYLYSRITTKLSRLKIKTTNEIGIDPDFMESIGFAWLAKQRINNQKFNLSTITGSQGELILGDIQRP